MKPVQTIVLIILLLVLVPGCQTAPVYDTILHNGVIYDGSGNPPFNGSIAISGDQIAAIGHLGGSKARIEIDVQGMAISPGFINMMCWANESLIEDGKSQSDIRQGVTLEVMGEGVSMGPLNKSMKDELKASQGDIKYDVEWSTLGEYLQFLEGKGVSPNVASFIGAATPRIYVIGYEDREPTPEELKEMRDLVGKAMQEGALGIASSLIYPPGSFASTNELIELSKVVAEYNGVYITHLRSEGSQLLKALDEFLTILKQAQIRGEIYHLKAAGKSNWHLLDQVIERVESAQSEGLEITADVYSYPASSTGLNSTMPPWVQEGGFAESIKRMNDPATRKKIIQSMNEESDEWENMFLGSGSPDNILLVGFKNPELKPLTGKTLAEVAEMRGTSPEETVMDLIIEDNSRIGTVYFSQSKENLRKKMALPWVSFCSDSASLAPEGVFLKTSVHPRAYGSFARVLAQFVREEKIISLPEAIRRLAAQPAKTLRIDRRGQLKEGFYADIVVFDPENIQDHATFEEPHQYSTGVIHVFVNGTQVLKDGEHTGATPGRFVKGPGWTGQAVN